MRVILTVTFLLLAFSATAFAHESHKGFKYESYCCNGDAEGGLPDDPDPECSRYP